MNSSSGDLSSATGNIRRTSSSSSWTEPEAMLHSVKTDDHKLLVTTPTSSARGGADPMVSFTVGGDGGEDDEGEIGGELTKRDIHTLNEQRRRDVIKHGYETLSDLIPTCNQSPSGAKMSRAAILQKTIDYIIYFQKQSERREEEFDRLKKEAKALEIMKENYEHIARAHQHAPAHEVPQVPEHVKFLVFQSIADQLFQSFNSSISVTSFDTLSSCIISWLEEYCKPQSLRELVVGNLQRVNALNTSPVFTSPSPTPPPPQAQAQLSRSPQLNSDTYPRHS